MLTFALGEASLLVILVGYVCLRLLLEAMLSLTRFKGVLGEGTKSGR